MSHDGEGVGKVDGYALFVKDTVIGDEVRVKIIKTKKTYGYARLMEIITPSALRVSARCPIARQCGGCNLQELDYAEQLKFKRGIIENNIRRIGGIADIEVEPVIGMEEPYFYRNKAQFPVGEDKDGNIRIGFYAGRTHSIIETPTCYIGAPVNELIVNAVREFMLENNVSAYNEEKGTGIIRHILIRCGYTTGEIMVCPVINQNKLPHADKLVEKLLALDFSGVTANSELMREVNPAKTGAWHIKSIMLNVNTKNTNVILGDKCVTLWGNSYIEDYIGDVKYRISPLSFYQVNPVQTRKLYQTALDYAGLTGNEVVWDLYCGIGTISLFLAKQAKKVYGVEIVPQAIDDARENARLNNIDNAEFFVGKAEEVLPDFYAKESARLGHKLTADVIVVAPPRKGCDETLLATMVQMEPERIVYVSCDSATLARDLKYLCGNGYEIKKCVGCDMFPQGVHVETVVLISKGMVDSRKVKVDFSLEDMDLSEFKGKATYEQIKAYVLEQTGLKVSSLYIAQIKKKCGLDVGENFNLSKSDNARQPQCTPEKEDAIMQAFRHFGII